MGIVEAIVAVFVTIVKAFFSTDKPIKREVKDGKVQKVDKDTLDKFNDLDGRLQSSKLRSND